MRYLSAGYRMASAEAASRTYLACRVRRSTLRCSLNDVRTGHHTASVFAGVYLGIVHPQSSVCTRAPLPPVPPGSGRSW
eukprot:2765356-Rhodomonas_salina.5